MNTAVDTDRIARAWAALDGVADPELPALTVRELGIVRDVLPRGDGIEVVLTATYSGCPATALIEANVRDALEQAGVGPVALTWRRAPAWTSDWIDASGRRKLHDYGIAPPGPVSADAARPVRLVRRDAVDRPACPRCGSARSEQLAAFGSTACKALYRCLDCREPFEYFKPI